MTETDSLTFEQLRLVIVVYTSSLVPLLFIPYLKWKNKISTSLVIIYLVSFFVCALGWELWFTYGFVNGDNVNLRRAKQLSEAIPMNLNWILNSLADAGTICIGGLYITWIMLKRNDKIFYKWNWSTFFILLTLFIGQNIFVEMFLYHDQLAQGKLISWAPLSPLGSWFNPILFQFNDRTISLQGQVPWLIMTPLFYGFIIHYLKSNNQISLFK